MSDENEVPDDEVLPHYDFKDGVRGKYADRYPQSHGANLVAVDSEIYAFFGNSDAVNSALRALMSIIQEREAKAEAGTVEASEAA
ncbi:MAG TPA: hypothetical protein VFJ16_00115 [Longimicrobium sp.]|nr:hypothetical protein [Longimicrobium sp.]